MKIIAMDNFARESVADFLVADGITNAELGKIMVDALNAKLCNHPFSPYFYKLVADDFRLSRGTEDFV